MSKEKYGFIDRFVWDPRCLQRLFLSVADESCKVKQSHNLWFPQIPWQCFLCLIWCWWRQLAAGRSLKVASYRADEVNALAQGALRQFTQWSWVESRTHWTFHVRDIQPLSYRWPMLHSLKTMALLLWKEVPCSENLQIASCVGYSNVPGYCCQRSVIFMIVAITWGIFVMVFKGYSVLQTSICNASSAIWKR